MNVVINHDGPKEHDLVLTSVVKSFSTWRECKSIQVYANEAHLDLHRFTEPHIVVKKFFEPLSAQCDLLIDYGGSNMALQNARLIDHKEYLGLIAPRTDEVDTHAFKGLYLKERVNRNLFQLMYGVAGLRWRGQGYGMKYFPRKRQKKNTVGVAIKNQSLRQCVRQFLNIEHTRIWQIPFKENLLKQFDEVNCAESVVTDDPFIMHVALCLRKHVEFLIYEPPNMRLELFGNGCVHLVPDDLEKMTKYVEELVHKSEAECERG